MTAERGVDILSYYESVVGFEDIVGMQAQFSEEVAGKLSELGSDHTTIIIPLIGGIYQWWRLQETAPKLVSDLQPNAVFVAKDTTGSLKLSKDVAGQQHVVVLDDIGDTLMQFGEICKLAEVQRAESIGFFAPVRKVHTLTKMEAFNVQRREHNLPEVNFFIPHCFPNGEDGNPIWVCSGFGMNEGPDPSKLPEGNVSGSLTSLAPYQRMAGVCLRRRKKVPPNYAMEIQHFALRQRQRANIHPDTDKIGRVYELIDLETYKGDWQHQFRLIDLLGW